MLFNYILFFVWLHAFISPVSDGKMPLKLICDAQPPVPDGQADEMSVSNMVFLSLLFSSAPGPTPIPRLPAYSPLAVPVYPGMGKRAKSTRFNLEKRMGRVRAWLNLLSIRFGQVVKLSHPGPTRVVHTPMRVLQPEPTASLTTAHQCPSGVLIDFSPLLGAYWLAVAWTLVTFGFTGVILARLVRVAHSEARELEELIDLYAEIDHDSPDGVFSCFSRPLSPASEALGFTSTGSEHLVIHSLSPSFLPSNPVPVSNNVIPLTGLDHLADLHTKTRSVIAPTPLHVEHSSFTSFAELDARSNHSVNKPGLHNSTSIIPAPDPSPKQQYSPEYKLELKAFIADVLSRQQRGERLQIGDMQLEDYERAQMDQASHLSVGSPRHDEFTRDIEDGIALGQGYSKSDFPPLSDQSSSSASFAGSSTHTQSLFSAVNSTLVPPPADTDELYPSLSTSTSFSSDISNDNRNDQDAANTTLDCEVAFADLCKEIGASLSSLDLAQQLESAGNSVESDLLLNSASFGADSEGFDQSDVVSASTSAVELREAILTGSDSSTLNDRPSPIFPSLFISPPAYFDDQYDTLMTYHRRRLEIHFNISVHLVGLEGDRQLICHRMHSCKTYRTKAIGMTGQVLSESLKDAARVVGNCYPEAQQNGATFKVGVRIATVTTRHHFDSNMDEWVSLGWESCECAFQLIVALDDSIPPPSPNPINNSNFPTHSPSFWARLWMYQLWDGPGDLFGPWPGGPNRYGNLIYAHM